MDKGRVGEESKGKEKDRCPLTVVMINSSCMSNLTDNQLKIYYIAHPHAQSSSVIKYITSLHLWEAKASWVMMRLHWLHLENRSWNSVAVRLGWLGEISC
jgi:hypothetical protein